MFLDDAIKEMPEDIGKVIVAISKGARTISTHLSFRVGLTEKLNPFGERQAELDIYSNDLFSNALLSTGVVGQVASEEMEEPKTSGIDPDNSISVAIDPIDGSSNITTNNSLGSIFGIWRGRLPQRGRDQIASAFVTYGPTLSITFTTGKSVDQYIEARGGEHSGRFIASYKSMKLPEKGEVYGFGGLRSDWIPGVERYVSSLENRKFKLRYGGTFIGDYNQILQKGGIFSYPALKGKPDGKFRLNYEASPVSLITQAAGGYSSNGRRSILDIEPDSLTQTTPLYTGNRKLVEELEAELAREK